MIKKITSTTVAALTMLTMFSSNAVYAQSDKDVDSKKEQAIVNVDKLNIRSGPSTSDDIIGGFELDDEVDLISIKDGWYKIELEDGKVAWTNGQYITLDGEVSAKKLNVRTGPSVLYDIVEFKEKEDKVKIIKAEDNGWYEIELKDGKTGYVCGKYIETEAKNLHDYSDLYNVATKSSKSQSSSSSKSTNSKKTYASSSSKKKSSSNAVTTMTVSATAYAGDGITATGTTPKPGRTIAVDPRVIPYGTRVYIPALGGTYIAEDCGGGIKGNKIDIFMSSEAKCNSWGVRNIEIQILK
ncbi:SH3 domain-containing protein [Intestinibacter sp.]|uniref:SH3 domain-containing protein n=1 Tax=Intestinibacter sp. TaxID=1965304 RepID=UPI002A766838|nr:SH3 domain-containing protein [Intestinibacter sp.]MDY2737963.1 SH3 domain-containing protein [Intestinibacter sp.]